jgi:hypothetical protein
MSILACIVTRILKTCGLQIDRRTTNYYRLCRITSIPRLSITFMLPYHVTIVCKTISTLQALEYAIQSLLCAVAKR